MAECESDHSLIGLFDLLAQRDPSKPGARVKVPSTITYRHGTMHSWFYTDKETGQISRRDKKHCSKEDIVAVFGVSSGPCAATVVFQKKGFLEEDVGLNTTSLEFLAPEALPLFVNKGGKRPDMLLQKFVQPLLNQNGGVEVIWTPYVCLVDHRKNVHDMYNDHYTLHDRCVTLEGKAHQALEVFTGPVINKRCAAVCEEMARHLQAQERRHLLRLVAYFKFDKYGDIVFLWATNVTTQRVSVGHTLSPKVEADPLSSRLAHDPDGPITPSSSMPPKTLSDLKAFVQGLTPKIYTQSDTPSDIVLGSKSILLHKLPKVAPAKGTRHTSPPRDRVAESRRRPLMNLTPKYTFPSQGTDLDGADDDYCIMREPQVGDWDDKKKVGLLQYERLSAAAEAAIRAVDECGMGSSFDFSSPKSRPLKSTVSSLSPLRLTSASAPPNFDSLSCPLSPTSFKSGFGTPPSGASLLSFNQRSFPLPSRECPPGQSPLVRAASDRPLSPLSLGSSLLSKRHLRHGWGRLSTRSVAHRSSAALRMWAQHALLPQQQPLLHPDALAASLPSSLRYCRGGGGGFYVTPTPHAPAPLSPPGQGPEPSPDDDDDDDDDDDYDGESTAKVLHAESPSSPLSPLRCQSMRVRRRPPQQALADEVPPEQESLVEDVHSVPLQRLLATEADKGRCSPAASPAATRSVFSELQRPELHHRYQRALQLHRHCQAWLEDVCYMLYSLMLDTHAPLTVEVPPNVTLWIGHLLAAFLSALRIPPAPVPGGGLVFAIDPAVTSTANLGKLLQHLKGYLHYCFLNEERQLVEDALAELCSPTAVEGPSAAMSTPAARRRIATACEGRLQEIHPELRRLKAEGADQPPVLSRERLVPPGPLSWPEGELLRMDHEPEAQPKPEPVAC
eukprot:GGOE01014906.1.p1 GENE.GGOE01014906.1~~GGOE01014906.1.p1  ORF type:complete len:899 (+),score=236.73 GGOE01014906.1:93-2789(+)